MARPTAYCRYKLTAIKDIAFTTPVPSRRTLMPWTIVRAEHDQGFFQKLLFFQQIKHLANPGVELLDTVTINAPFGSTGKRGSAAQRMMRPGRRIICKEG